MKVFFTSNGEAPFLPAILLENAPIYGGDDDVFEGCGWVKTKVEIDVSVESEGARGARGSEVERY